VNTEVTERSHLPKVGAPAPPVTARRHARQRGPRRREVLRRRDQGKFTRAGWWFRRAAWL